MANEFVIKNGFISKGDSIVSGSLSGETLNLTTTPSNDNSQTQVLVRNNTTGLVEYRDASTFSGASGSNTFVTGTTFGSNQSITRRNDGADVLILTGGTNVTLSNPSSNQIKIDVNIPAGMNTYVTGFTYNDNNTFTIFDNDGGSFPATFNQVSGLTVNGILSATTISGGTYYGDGSNLTGISTDDNYVTGGTFSTNTLTLNRQNGSVIVTGFTSDSNTFVTGGTYNASTVTLDFSGNTGFSPFNVDVSALKDDTNTYVTGNTYTSATNSTNQSSLSLLYQGTATGGPYSLSSEDTFITGTTFSSNEATLTRNDGTEVLKLTGGTNVTLSNPSSNQIKIDVSSSSSSIDTGNVLWVDNIFGNDGTALVDRQDKPWSSIATAIGNASTNDTIMVRPGEYVEPDFTLVPSTSLVSQGGAKVTFISASTNTGNFITVSGSSYMEGFTLYTPIDDSAALYFNDPTGGIVTSFHNVHFKGSSTDSPPLGKGVVMDSGLTNGKIIYTELRYGGSNLDRLVEVNKGIFALDGMHVPGGGTINTGIQVNGGRAQLINVNIGNPLCDTALSVSGTSSNKPVVVGFGFNIFNVPTGIEITSDDYDVEVQGGRLEAGTTNVLVSSGLTGSNGKLNLTGFIMDSTKLSVPFTWVDSVHTFQYSDIGNSQNIEPILRTWANFEVGHANKGFETNLGRGSEYQNGLHVHTSGASSTSDYTLSAKTPGSTFTFESLTAGEQLYLGSSQYYPDGTQLNFNGFEALYTGSTGGTYTMEFYSGGTWVDIKYQCVHHNLGYNYGNTLFGRNVESKEDMRFGIDESITWDSLNIASFGGHTAKWIRITMVTPPASLPQFDLIWLEPSHTEVNDNGVLSFFGNSLYRDTLVSAGNIFGLDGNVADGDITIGSTVTWNQIMENSKLTTSGMGSLGDAVMLQTILPKGVCTSYPLRITIHYILENTANNNAITTLPTVTLGVVTKETYNNTTADPTGGLVPTRRTFANTTSLDNGGIEFDIGLGEVGQIFGDEGGSNFLSITDDYDFDISSLYESDGVFIRVTLTSNGAPNQSITIPAIEASIVKWALGERIRIE